LTANGLPLGLQFIGKAFDEATILRAARAIELASGFDAKPVQWWRAP
jgi:aspartyl-tRNA(Asn)/glutamyl-tRNA(Gln) amidotransferase subunit A